MSNLGPQFSRLHRAYGSNDVDSLFAGNPRTASPWPQASRRKDRKDYDESIVQNALRSKPELVDVDPRELHATQPDITRSGVQHYMSGEYDRTGKTYADQHNAGNRYPFVYEREDGQRLLLSGHHRAARALIRGEPLKARRVAGPWGPPRGQ